VKLSAIFDGERHEFVPGEDFPDTGAAQVVIDWAEIEEDGELSPFESAAYDPILKDTRDPKLDDPRFPNSRTEQAWGTLSIALSAFCQIAEIDKESAQRINHEAGITRFTFETKEHVTERM